MIQHLLVTDMLSALVRDPAGVVARHSATVGEETVATTPIRPNDLWTAAPAIAAERVVVTGNVREFRRVSGLAAED